jgi:hypothetical protein
MHKSFVLHRHNKSFMWHRHSLLPVHEDELGICHPALFRVHSRPTYFLICAHLQKICGKVTSLSRLASASPSTLRFLLSRLPSA